MISAIEPVDVLGLEKVDFLGCEDFDELGDFLDGTLDEDDVQRLDREKPTRIPFLSAILNHPTMGKLRALSNERQVITRPMLHKLGTQILEIRNGAGVEEAVRVLTPIVDEIYDEFVILTMNDLKDVEYEN